MGRVTVGYQDGCLHPLWLTNTGLRLARLFGAESLWVPDHFMGFIAPQVWTQQWTAAAKVVHSADGFFDPLQILAVTALRLRGVDLGTAVTEAIRRHPMSLAQAFVTLDHLSHGHAILGIGNGERENIEPWGLPWSRQVSRLEEALTIIRLLWASGGKPLTYEGRFWKLRDAVFDLPLYKGRPPRIWVAAHAPRMLALAGRFGDGWLPTLKVTGEEYRNRLETIKEARVQAKRPLKGFVPAQVLIVAMGSSRREVLEVAMGSRVAAAFSLAIPASLWKLHGCTHPLGDDHRGFIDIVPSRVSDAEIDQAARSMTEQLLLASLYAGSPAEIRDEVAPLVEAGARHLVIANIGGALRGGGPADLWRLGSLIRKLRRL